MRAALLALALVFFIMLVAFPQVAVELAVQLARLFEGGR